MIYIVAQKQNRFDDWKAISWSIPVQSIGKIVNQLAVCSKMEMFSVAFCT